MLRRRKGIALTVATLCLAGCAKSDSRMSPQAKQQWGQVPRIADLPEAEPPKILAETRFAAARLLESQGSISRAMIQYRKVIAVNHSYAPAYHRLGLLLSMAGKREEAVAAFRRVVQLRPKDPTLRNNLGFELLLSGQWSEAERALEHAVRIEPGFARARVNLGIVQSKLGRFADALASFREALPEADAQYNLGLMYRGQKRYRDAAETFRHVLTINPQFVAASAQLEQMAERIDAPTLFDRETKVAVAPVKVKPPTRSLQNPKQRAASVERARSTADASSWDGAVALLDEVFAPLPSVNDTATTPKRPRDRTVQPRSKRQRVPSSTRTATGRTTTASVDQSSWKDVAAAIEILENEFNCRDQQHPIVFDHEPLPVTWQTEQVSFLTAPTLEICESGEFVGQPVCDAEGDAGFDEDPWRPAPVESFADNFAGTLEQVALHEPVCWQHVTDPATMSVALNLPTFSVGDTLLPETGAVSSPDSWALLRELEANLAIVRNEITCADGLNDSAADAARFARQLRRFKPQRNLGPTFQSPGDGTLLMGPPAELASSKVRTPPSSRPSFRNRRRARLVSDEEKATTNRPLLIRDRRGRIKDAPQMKPGRRPAKKKAPKAKPTKSTSATWRSLGAHGPIESVDDVFTLLDKKRGLGSERHDAVPTTASNCAFDANEPTQWPVFDIDNETLFRRPDAATIGRPMPLGPRTVAAPPVKERDSRSNRTLGHHKTALPQ